MGRPRGRGGLADGYSRRSQRPNVLHRSEHPLAQPVDRLASGVCLPRQCQAEQATSAKAKSVTMQLADPEAALAILREFLRLLEAGYGNAETTARAAEMQPTIEEIAKRIDPDNVGRLSEKNRHGGWDHGPASTEALRLIGILEDHELREQILGPVGPALAASGLHPWVWNAAASLWGGGHYGPAVHEAAKALELHTQLKVNRRDLSGKKLYSHVFSTGDPASGGARLRFPHISKVEQPDDWTSAHEGAMHLGMGCAQGIRNPQAHPSTDIGEQESLEQLAALSVLARWVDACDVVNAVGDTAGE